MKTLVALGASSSKKSINKTFAVHVASKVTDTSITVVDLKDYELPLYSVDREAEIGVPTAARKFNEIIEFADGLIISLAEHNGTYTAVFKNLLDWLTRIDLKVWKGKPMLLLSTSPGNRGAATVLGVAKSYFPFIEGNIVADFSFPSFYENFSNEGIVNTELASKLDEKIAVFEHSLEKVDAMETTQTSVK